MIALHLILLLLLLQVGDGWSKPTEDGSRGDGDSTESDTHSEQEQEDSRSDGDSPESDTHSEQEQEDSRSVGDSSGSYSEQKDEDSRIDGGWSEWTPTPCQRGEKQRRKCDNPKPKHGGKKCEGPKKRFCPRCEWSDPCQNDGACIDGISADQYTCDCVAGYTGVNCETDINECESNPCKNSGSCEDRINGYTCLCEEGFTGDHCETPVCLLPFVAHRIDFDGHGFVVMTTLGDEVFAMKSAEDSVRVYDAATMTLKRSLSVPDLGTVGGLAASTRDNYLYASSSSSGEVFKIEPASGAVVSRWDVGEQPMGMAITSGHNLIVTLQGDRKIKLFTPGGTLLGVGSGGADLSLFDVAQMPSGQFLVADAGLDIFGNGYIIHADPNNNRVLILNPSRTSAQVLQVAGLDVPMTVRIDESRDRAYIGEAFYDPGPGEGWIGGGRLLVIGNVSSCLVF